MNNRVISLASSFLNRRGVIVLCICIVLIVVTSSLAACASTASTVTDIPNDVSSEISSLQASPTQTPPPDGDIAPDFTGVDVITNETISLSQFTGSTVLLNFVNYGCSRSLNKIVSDQLFVIRALKEQGSDFTPVSVFCGCCVPSVLKDFAMENDLIWPWILDSGNSIIRQYYDNIKKYGYPTLVLIDGNQYIRGASGFTEMSELSSEINLLSRY